MSKTVREFSPAGPCLMLGQLSRETAKFYVFRDRADGAERRLTKRRAHVEPCRCCRDHEHSMYPHGYMD